jgi:uncharacterized protein (DUF58 family)
MLPIPRLSAFALLGGATLALLLAAATASPLAALVGGVVLVVLAGALAASMPIGRRVRRERLEFAWWLAHGDPGSGGGAAVPGVPFEVRCFVRHRGHGPLLLRSLEPLVPGGAHLIDEPPEGTALLVPPHSRTELSFRLIAPAAGRVVLHGMAVVLEGPLGLFGVPLYFPNPLVIKVLPQAALKMASLPRARTGQSVDRSGSSLLSAGGGTELRELREMQPGDPFKQIAWKASAKRGRWLVREVEQEVQETRTIVLDVSGTMRGGPEGRRKLDYAIEAVAAEARRSIGRGDRVGLSTVDGRIVDHVIAGDGAPQLLRIFDALLRATEVVDEDLTEADDDDVVRIVGRYVRQQDGLDLSTPPANGRPASWNVTALVRHAEAALLDGGAAEAGHKDETVRASGPAMATLRRFCRVRGIPLPYRADPRDGGKATGLGEALKQIERKGSGPTDLIVVSDLDGLGQPDPFLSALRLVRGRGHRVRLIVPDGVSFVAPPSTELAQRLYDVYARGERRRVEDVRALVAPLGVEVSVVGRDRPAALAISAGRGRRGRAA